MCMHISYFLFCLCVCGVICNVEREAYNTRCCLLINLNAKMKYIVN